MTPELKQLLIEQVRPEVLQQVFDLIEGKKLTAEAFKNMAIECDNDEQMRHVFSIALYLGLEIMSITKDIDFKYFRYSVGWQAYSNFRDYTDQTPIHYTDFINQYK